MRVYENKKGWKLHCFSCKDMIPKDEKFWRDRFGIYCYACGCEREADREFEDHCEYEERKQAELYRKQLENWERSGRSYPRPRTPEERLIDEANVRKYGEC